MRIRPGRDRLVRTRVTITHRRPPPVPGRVHGRVTRSPRPLLQLRQGRLSEGHHGDEALGEGVVDLARPALPLGRSTRRMLGGHTIGVLSGQGLQRLLLGRRHPEGIGPGHLHPGHPGARDQREQHHGGGHQHGIVGITGVQGHRDTHAQHDNGDRGGPEAGVHQPHEREEDEQACERQWRMGQRSQEHGRQGPGEAPPRPGRQRQAAQRLVHAAGPAIAARGEDDQPPPPRTAAWRGLVGPLPGHHRSTVSRREMMMAATTPATSQAVTTASPLPVSQVPVGSATAKAGGRRASRMSSANQRTGSTENP